MELRSSFGMKPKGISQSSVRLVRFCSTCLSHTFGISLKKEYRSGRSQLFSGLAELNSVTIFSLSSDILDKVATKSSDEVILLSLRFCRFLSDKQRSFGTGLSRLFSVENSVCRTSKRNSGFSAA